MSLHVAMPTSQDSEAPIPHCLSAELGAKGWHFASTNWQTVLMSEVTVDAHLLVYADRSAQCAAYFHKTEH